MAYIYDIADTWNASGTTFTAIKMNVTDTASAAGSLLMDLQVGGVSKFSVDKAGVVTFATGSINRITQHSNRLIIDAQNDGISLGAAITLNWRFGTTGGTPDLILLRDAAGILAQRNGVNAQTQRLYGTYTDASNYRRLTKTMSTGGVAEIKPEGAGTGASGNVLHISGLPTSNPGAGILWNNLGSVVVGT
jgi:hypothetical protein